MKTSRCLCCGKPLKDTEQLYHQRCTRRLFGTTGIPVLNYTQDQLNELAKNIIMEHISVPGVQPKLSLHLEKGNAASHSRLTLVGLEGDYILKPQSPQWPHLPEAEHFCMLLARKCKIATAEFGLVSLASGELAYITRRMDRTPDGMLHMEDFCQILNKMTAQKYSGSMEQVGKALREYSHVPGLDTVRFFELALFCFLTGNSDMHLKNYSIIRLSDGHYELSPAYDLVPVKIILPADREELALTMCGKKSNFKRTDFEGFGNVLHLSEKQIGKTMSRIANAVAQYLPESLDASFLPDEMKIAMSGVITNRLARIR